MSIRSIVYTFSIVLAATALAAASKSPIVIDLFYGTPIRIALRGAVINYAGRDIVRVKANNGHWFRFDARTPAQLSVSPTGRYLFYNFGNGSGQIYDVAVYSLPAGAPQNIRRFKSKVLAFAHSVKSCKAHPDQISFAAEEWIGEKAIKIRTEDWTRRPGCDILNRRWTIRL